MSTTRAKLGCFSACSLKTEADRTLFKAWLRSGTGCSFATSLARARGDDEIKAKLTSAIAVVRLPASGAFPTAEDVAFLPGAIDAAREANNFFAACAPAIRTPSDVCRFLKLLTSDSAWRLTRRATDEGGAACVCLDYVVSGRTTNVLGVGPHPLMPVTRRAPYWGIVLWPGERTATYMPPGRTKLPKALGLIDAHIGLDDETTGGLWETTARNVADLFASPEQADIKSLHRRSFYFPEDVFEATFPDMPVPDRASLP